MELWGEQPWSWRSGKAEKKAFSSKTSQLPISYCFGPGWGRSVFSDWTADEGARVHEIDNSTEGAFPAPHPPQDQRRSRVLETEGSKQPTWLGGLPQSWLLAPIGKASGGLAPNPLPKSLSSRRSQGTMVVVFH